MDRELLSKKEKRNLNPHSEAFLCMMIYGGEYANQDGGCMDFWDKQTQATQRKCVELIERMSHMERVE